MRLKANTPTVDLMNKTNAEFLYLNYMPSMIRKNARCTRKINSSIAMAKAAFKIRNAFQKQIGLNFLEGTSKLLHLQQVICMMLNIAHCRKQIVNNRRVLNCGAVDGRRRPGCSIVWEVKKHYI
jgi:hypothetical protein